MTQQTKRDLRIFKGGVVHMVDKYAPLVAAARAVIAAGRPHTNDNCGNLNPPICPCPQCAAWDGLAALLKETTP